MIKSKYTIWASVIFLLCIFSLFVTIFFLFAIFNDTPKGKIIIPLIIFLLLFLFMFIWFRGELRTKIGDVEIDKNFIVVATYFGLAVPNRYELKNIDYFNISVVYSKGGSYEFIILSQNNKSVIFISQYYHKNYFEMKNILRKKIKYKGYKKFNTVEYFKELIF